MIPEEFAKLKKLASCDVCQNTEWVTQEWAEEHFGSEAEAKFVVAANPAAILKLINTLERIKAENAELRGRCTPEDLDAALIPLKQISHHESPSTD